MINLTSEQVAFINKLIDKHGNLVRRKQVLAVSSESGLPPQKWLLQFKQFKSRYGVYDLSQILNSLNGVQKENHLLPSSNKAIATVNSEQLVGTHEAYIPDVDPLYVPFGHFNDIKKIVQSKIFYPIYIAGLSGNGKTTMVEQICAISEREIMRVNITKNTDEDDLFGGFRLVNGETVWFDGPVIKAMKSGSILLLDEVDLGTSNCMCLQPVLEGKGVLLKKINQFVKPLPGFNIIATANTKGKGSEDGRFIGTNVMNEAFLERFAITFEQEYPNVTIEKKILDILFTHHSIKDDEFVETLTKWSDIIRKTFLDGGVDEVISTRRLVHVANAYAIFNDKEKAIQLCINRFDTNTKNTLMKFYTCLVNPKEEVPVQEEVAAVQDELAGLPELEPINP